VGQGVSQTLGAPKGKDGFALTKVAITGERQSREILAVDFQEGQINFLGHADDSRRDELRAHGESLFRGALHGAGGQQDLDALRAADNVGVGDDEAAGVDDEARANGALAADDDAGAAVFALFEGTVAGDQDLHDAGSHSLDERLD